MKRIFTHDDASPLRRKIPPPTWEEIPDLLADLPPHPQTNSMKQVNAR